MTGLWHKNLWQGEKKAVDFFVVKGIVEGLFEKLGITEGIEFAQSERKELHPGRTANILHNGSLVGFIGQLHPSVEKELDLSDTYVFELDLHRAPPIGCTGDHVYTNSEVSFCYKGHRACCRQTNNGRPA